MAVVATLSKAYDLEHICKQVDRGPVKDAASYYLQASENGGEPSGRWWGPGAKALGLLPGQVVERKPLAGESHLTRFTALRFRCLVMGGGCAAIRAAGPPPLRQGCQGC